MKQISDFFMYLYQNLNRRPSTIDGCRTAIVDTLGLMGQHIAHNEDLHRLLSSFHRDRPKSSRNLPKWNLSVVLNELTKAPFEPMKDTDLKHLTLKTAFFFSQMFIYRFWTKVRSIWRGEGRQPPIKCLTVIEVKNKVQLFMNRYTSYTFYVISVNTDIDTFRHRTFIKFTCKLFTEVLISFDMDALQKFYQV